MLSTQRPSSSIASQFHNPEFAICELVLIELYVLLRNPNVLESPMSNCDAVSCVNGFRSNPHWAVIDYPGDLMSEIWQRVGSGEENRRHIFDLRLAFTLRHHGIRQFATRNVRDFKFPFLEIVNPIDDS